MIILAIESTCDETSAAIVEDGQRVYCNVTYSQIKEHNKTGGVVPEVAARRHVEAIVPVLEEALRCGAEKMGVDVSEVLKKLDAVAVAQGPGLLGCLMVGNNAATALSLIWDKPLIPVHHIEGHLYASWLTDNCEKNDGGGFVREILPYDPKMDGSASLFCKASRAPCMPILILTVSGGHNQLILMKDHGEYEMLGETLDDAAGEAFDKVARMLGLGYPGGPEIQKTAMNGNKANGMEPGNPMRYKLPRAMMKNEHAEELNFSFSGLKTAVRTLVLKLKREGELHRAVPDVAASFEYTVCDTLLMKLKKAAGLTNPREIHIAGGVSANLRLRKMLEETFPQGKILYPSLKFCTDNAAMIGAVAYFRYMANPRKYEKLRNSAPDVNLKFY